MKILYRDEGDGLSMFDTITNTINFYGRNNDYRIYIDNYNAYICKGSQSEIQNIFNDIVAAEKRGDKVFEIK